jgi:arsenate reductase
MGDPPLKRILFVCIENSNRSQMAEGWAHVLNDGSWEVRSGGSKPSRIVNPSAVEAMKEIGIDISRQVPKDLPEASDGEWDILVTLGCKDACPDIPAKERVDWDIPDPKGKPLGYVREVRDVVKSMVKSVMGKG